MSKFGEKLDEIMFERKKTPTDIQKILGLGNSVVYSWLRNEEIPTFQNLVKLANALNCSIDFLAGLSTDDGQNRTYKECPPFGERLRFVMKEHNKTEYRIAKDTKISRASFFEWFNNIRLPYLDSLIKLAKYLDCTIDYLVGRED